MAKTKLTLNTLAELDHGKLAKMVEHEMHRCLDSVRDMPDCQKARELKIVAKFTPGDGEGLRVDFEFAVGSKIPGQSSRRMQFGLRQRTERNGQTRTEAVVDEDSLDDAAQMTLGDAAENQ